MNNLCVIPPLGVTAIAPIIICPTVTIVAACISDDTGVGPSIASTSQIYKPICADFPTAPISNNIHNFPSLLLPHNTPSTTV